VPCIEMLRWCTSELLDLTRDSDPRPAILDIARTLVGISFTHMAETDVDYLISVQKAMSQIGTVDSLFPLFEIVCKQYSKTADAHQLTPILPVLWIFSISRTMPSTEPLPWTDVWSKRGGLAADKFRIIESLYIQISTWGIHEIWKAVLASNATSQLLPALYGMRELLPECMKHLPLVLGIVSEMLDLQHSKQSELSGLLKIVEPKIQCPAFSLIPMPRRLRHLESEQSSKMNARFTDHQDKSMRLAAQSAVVDVAVKSAVAEVKETSDRSVMNDLCEKLGIADPKQSALRDQLRGRTRNYLDTLLNYTITAHEWGELQRSLGLVYKRSRSAGDQMSWTLQLGPSDVTMS
jgi:hypothetical protein